MCWQQQTPTASQHGSKAGGQSLAFALLPLLLSAIEQELVGLWEFPSIAAALQMVILGFERGVEAFAAWLGTT